MKKSDKALFWDLFHYLNNYVCVSVFLFSLLESIKELEKEKLSLQSESESYTDQVTDLSSGLIQHFVTLSVNFQLLLS